VLYILDVINGTVGCPGKAPIPSHLVTIIIVTPVKRAREIDGLIRGKGHMESVGVDIDRL